MPAGGPIQPALSFPKTTFAKLSPSPYLHAHLTHKPAVRPSGRTPNEFRAVHINTSSLTHTQGSAVVRTGETTVVCGIRAEILLVENAAGYRADTVSIGHDDGNTAAARQQLQELDLLVPNIELATGCSAQFLPGNPPSTLAQSLSTRVYSLLHSSNIITPSDLRIVYTPERGVADTEMTTDDDDDDDASQPEVKAFWTLHIDILFISLDGNAFDTAWGAVLGALCDVRLPRAYWDADREAVLCSDDIAQTSRLRLGCMPIASSFAVFTTGTIDAEIGHADKADLTWILADPDNFEEGLCSERMTVVLDCAGDTNDKSSGPRLLGLSKSGGAVMGMERLRELLELAERRWVEWHLAFKPTLVA